MGLKQISDAGVMADTLRESAQLMNRLVNTYQGKYDFILNSVQSSLGINKSLSTLSDTEVNSFFFGGLGDSETVINAQIILNEWERLISALNESVRVLPVNDI